MATTIPRAVLEYVTEEVNALSADAQARVLAVLASIEWTPENIAECRDILIQALAAIMPTYTDAAAQVGADMYDAVRETAVGEAMGATAISGYEPEATAGAVKAFVQDIVDGKPVEQFNRKVLSRVDREIRRAENMSVAENAARDPLKPRYARVPRGSETCGFCLMLASFGFQYTTDETASHAHDNCDCRVVAQFGGSRVEGYDPDEMYEHYKQCLDSLGGTSGIRRQWKSLPEEERKKRIEEHGGKESDAFQAFLNGRMSAEIETRDPEWFRTGKVPEVDYTYRPRSSYGRLLVDGDYDEENIEIADENEWRDLFAIDTLQRSGFVVGTRPKTPTDANGKELQGVTNPDITIGKALWEIKSPRDKSAERAVEDELSFIQDAAKSTKRNFRNPYDPSTHSAMPNYGGGRRMVLNLRYKSYQGTVSDVMERVARESSYYGISESIVIFSDGTIGHATY